uniref:Voltage-dependent L-type calcium channel subunit alpha-1C (Trinotate prediction) n=1 Tax=Henneguya salminicola TaxID=69463 RepID=A0A6G3MDL9_HENSL
MLIFLILEIIAYGFVLHKGSYLRNASRVIEILSIIQLIISLIPTRFLTKYTVAAILIPLRLLIIINGFFVVYRIKIIRIFTLKMISLIYSSRYFFVVLFISHIVMSIIGLYAINESKYYCSDIHAPIHHCRGYYFIYDDVKDGNIILTPRKIKPSSLDYDNIYNSFNSIMALRYFSLSDFYSFKKLFIISTNFSQQTITTLLIFIFIFTFLREAIIRPTQWAIFFYLNPDMTKNTFKIEYDEYDYLDLFMKNMLKTIPTNERDFKLHRLITSNIYKLANFSFNFLFLCLSVWQNSDKFLVISLFSKICYLLIHCVYISIVLIIECLLFKKNVYKRAYPYLCACLYLGCFGEIFIQLLEKCGTNSLKYVFIFRILQIFGQFKIFLNFDIFGILFMEIIKFSKIIFILIVICSFLFYIFLIMGTSMFHNIAQDSNSYINEYQNFLYFGATFMTILRY